MKIGLLGYGTVGKGVFDILEEQPKLEVKYVLDLRDLPELGEKLTKDLNVILSDPEVDTVVELIGGMNPAYDFVKKSLLAGKNVVTANKLMVSLHYGELVGIAKEKDVSFRYSAAVGGGIPWLVNLQRAHRVSRLESVYGIMNGTTNYILDAMVTDGQEFDVALAEAQRLGFAEADPSSDIDGLDTRHKTTLSADVAFGVDVDDEKVATFGIRRVKKCDIDAAKEAGYVLKLFGTALREEKGVAAYVEPTLVPAETPEGNIRGCDNVIAFEGSHIGKTRFVGAGAGRYPTGYAVVQDLVDLDMGLGCLYNEKMDVAEVNNAAARHAYYVRTDFTEDAYFAALEKKALGQGFVTEETSVAEMHEFAARAMAAGKEIFIAGFWK